MSCRIIHDDVSYQLDEALEGIYLSREDGGVLTPEDYQAINDIMCIYNLLHPEISFLYSATSPEDYGNVARILIKSESTPPMSIQSSTAGKKTSLKERLLATWHRFWAWLESW